MILDEYQEKHIKLIKDVLNIIPNNYVLKGGTALLLDYNLNRFSEDIDLDYLINNKQQINLKNALIKFCNQNNYSHSTKKDTSSVLRFVIYYDERILKIESSSRDLVKENEYHQSLNGKHNDIVEFIYEEMDGKLYCDRLFINDLSEKEIILPNYKVPFNMIEKWYEAYHTMMKFLQYNNY